MCEDAPCCGCCGDEDFDLGDFDSYAEDYGYDDEGEF